MDCQCFGTRPIVGFGPVEIELLTQGLEQNLPGATISPLSSNSLEFNGNLVNGLKAHVK